MKAFHFDRRVLPLPLPDGHRFPAGKYGLLREAVRASPQGIELVESGPASEGELALAHDPSYVGAVLDGTLDAARQREIGFPWSPEMVARALHSVGATIAASRAALAEGVAASLGGGTHHASADRGSGWCVFNDVAVSARLMQAEWHRQGRHDPGEPREGLRVVVIDLDVHQGNGTAAIFADDPTVFTFSVHGDHNFPFRKVAGDLDVGLPDGCGDDEYLAAVDEGLLATWRRLEVVRPRPGLAYYLAGADPHEGDRLGRLRVTRAGLGERDRRVLDALRDRGIPAVVLMAGGYGREIERTVEVHLQTLRRAQASWAQWRAGQGGAPRDEDDALPCPAGVSATSGASATMDAPSLLPPR
jgi:acetoin utilization deacetylase AcuC-like enzyme